MRYINQRFTYLLSYCPGRIDLCTYSMSISLNMNSNA